MRFHCIHICHIYAAYIEHPEKFLTRIPKYQTSSPEPKSDINLPVFNVADKALSLIFREANKLIRKM